MTTIESKKVTIAKPAKELYAFLSDMNNFEQLLPQGRISEWKSDGVSCSFKVQGAATIGLALNGGDEPTLLKMKATDRSPFPFSLDVHLQETDGVTTAWQLFNGDINPFIKMMVEKPLKNLFDHIADRMVAVHGGGVRGGGRALRYGPVHLWQQLTLKFAHMYQALLPVLLLVAMSSCRKDSGMPKGGGGPWLNHIELSVDSACVQAPNVITPDGDGVNDVFVVYARNVASISISIHNAQGDPVFSTDNAHTPWHGDVDANGPYTVHVAAFTTSGQALSGTSPLHVLGYGPEGCVAFNGSPVCGDQFDPRLCGVVYGTNDVFCE